MAKQDKSAQVIRNLLLKNGVITPNAYGATNGKITREDSMRAAIAARKASFQTQQKQGEQK